MRFYIFFLVIYALHVQADSTEQPPTPVYATLSAFVAQQLPVGTDYTLRIAPLDTRLQLTPCAQALVAFSNTPIKPGRNSIGIRCAAANAWSVYLMVQVQTYQSIAILKQAVKRGDILTAQHLGLNRTETTNLHSGFITDLENVIGKQTTRALAQGSILTARDLTLAIMVKRGETVTITADKGPLMVQMSGIALTDGAQGQRIRVKNSHSNRIVFATVLQPGKVNINF